jgi:hypothetical protein
LVDANRTGGTTLGQLADYVAMAGLAQVDLDADFTNASTILNLIPGYPSFNRSAGAKRDLAVQVRAFTT